MQELLDAIRDTRAPAKAACKLVENIVALASDKSFSSLGPEARRQRPHPLAAVPKERWDAEGWINLAAGCDAWLLMRRQRWADVRLLAILCANHASRRSLGWDLAVAARSFPVRGHGAR